MRIDRPGDRRALGRTGRRAALSAHVLASGAWLGIDVVLVVLVATAALTTHPEVAGLCLRTLPLLLWPLAVAGLLTAATGLLLGWGTRYGLVRYRWVATKIVITLVYLALIPLGLAPTVLDRAELGQALLDGRALEAEVGDLAYPALVGPTLLVTAVVLSVVKPWGRLRSSGAP